MTEVDVPPTASGLVRRVRVALGAAVFLGLLYGVMVILLWLAYEGWLPRSDHLLAGRTIHRFYRYWAHYSRLYSIISGGLVAGVCLAAGLRLWVRRVGGWRRFWPRFAFSAGLTLVLAELVLRMALLHPQLPLRPLQDPNLVASSFSDEAWWVLGYRHGYSDMKLAEITHPLLGYGQEPPREDNPLGLYAYTRERLGSEGPRILFFGDSFVHGMPFNQTTLPEMVEAQLADGRPVANLGVRGYGLDQIYLLAHELGTPRRGDTLLVGVLTWDIDRTVFSFMFGQKPRFVVQDGALRLSNIPFPSSNQKFLRSFKVSYPSFLIQALKRKWARLRNLDIVEGGQAEEKRQITRAILAQWSREIAAAGAQMTVVLFHTRQDIATQDWRNEVVRETCGELGILLLDTADVLLPYLRERNSFGDELYEPNDFHHTDLANQLIAAQIAGYLSKDGTRE